MDESNYAKHDLLCESGYEDNALNICIGAQTPMFLSLSLLIWVPMFLRWSHFHLLTRGDTWTCVNASTNAKCRVSSNIMPYKILKINLRSFNNNNNTYIGFIFINHNNEPIWCSKIIHNVWKSIHTRCAGTLFWGIEKCIDKWLFYVILNTNNPLVCIYA